jgi:hypothetical protein
MSSPEGLVVRSHFMGDAPDGSRPTMKEIKPPMYTELGSGCSLNAALKAIRTAGPSSQLP